MTVYALAMTVYALGMTVCALTMTVYALTMTAQQLTKKRPARLPGQGAFASYPLAYFASSTAGCSPKVSSLPLTPT
jgi:hypothetical protein